jgi:hypothetical protein
MIHTGQVPVTSINLTEDELTTLVYAMHSWDRLMQTVPRVEDFATRSEAMTKRRAAHRFNQRIQSLAKGYGIELPGDERL